MKKLLLIVLALILCAGASAEAADFILPVGVPFGATVEEVTAVDPALEGHDLGSKTIYVGFAPAELFGLVIESHNYVFDENGGLIYYTCGFMPEDVAAFEEALKANYSELIPVSADGMMLDYTATTGELSEEYWITREAMNEEYTIDGFDVKLLSQYLTETEAGYAVIMVEDISMGEGEEYYEFCACYFTLLNDAACEVLAADAKIAG